MKYLKFFKTEHDFSQSELVKPFVTYIEENNKVGVSIPSFTIVFTDGTKKAYYDKNIVTYNDYEDKSTIKSVWINCTTIGNAAFYDCPNLERVYMTDNVVKMEAKTVVQKGAFEKCSKLYSVRLSHGLSEIGEGAFARSSIAEINIPDNITKIKNAAFYVCSNLQRVNSDIDGVLNLPLSMNVNIEQTAFYDCNKIHYMYIEGAKTIIYQSLHVNDLREFRFSNKMTGMMATSLRNQPDKDKVTYLGTVEECSNTNYKLNQNFAIGTEIKCTDGIKTVEK